MVRRERPGGGRGLGSALPGRVRPRAPVLVPSVVMWMSPGAGLMMTFRVAVSPVGEVLAVAVAGTAAVERVAVVVVQAGVLWLTALSLVLLPPTGPQPVVMSRMMLSAAM